MKKHKKTKAIAIRDGKLSISSLKLETLRHDSNFIELVRIGRVLNALMHIDDLWNLKPIVGNSAADRFNNRYFKHAAAILYESFITLVNVKGRFTTTHGVGKILSDAISACEEHTDLLVYLRNAGAFHLDTTGKLTKNTLRDMKLKQRRYELFQQGRTQQVRDFHFTFADDLDVEALLMHLKTASRKKARREAAVTITVALTDAIVILTRACRDAIVQLVTDLKLAHPVGP